VETDAELNRRGRPDDGWLAPHHVEVLIEHGHVREVERLAGEGDFCCARAIAARHAEQGRHEDALALLTPFADTGWWHAVESVAGVLASCGRAGEAIDLAIEHAEAGERSAVNYAAALLAADGRVDEAFALLRPRVADSFHARALVDLSDGLGRDEEVIDALDECAATAAALERWQAAGLLATVLERTGRVDDAVATLQRHVRGPSMTSVHLVEHLADLLARHDRREELRALIGGHGGDRAACRLARHLEHAGDVDGAVAVLAPLAATGRPHPAIVLADLLVRTGQADTALQILNSGPVGGEADWPRYTWAELMAASGRADEALAVLDDPPGAAPGSMSWELFERRLGLLAAGGRIGQAVDELRAHPHAGEWYAAWSLAALLDADGRQQEALEALESSPDHSLRADLHARLLVGQGRIDEAVAMMRRRTASDGWG